MRPRRFNLQLKLLGNAGLILVLMAVIAITGITSLSSVNTVAQETFADATQPLAELGTARATANETRALLATHITARGPAERKDIEGKIAANDKVVDASLTAVEATLQTQEGKDDVRGAPARPRRLPRAARRGARPLGDVAVARQPDRRRGGRAEPRGGGTAVHRRLRASSPRCSSPSSSSPSHHDEQIESTYTSKRTLALVLLALGIVLGLLASWWIARGIRRSVADVLVTLESLASKCVAGLQDALRAMAAGDLTVSVTPVTPPIERFAGDEMGDVARQVNVIREQTVKSVEEYNAARVQLTELLGRVSSGADSVSVGLPADGGHVGRDGPRGRRDRQRHRRRGPGRRAPGPHGRERPRVDRAVRAQRRRVGACRRGDVAGRPERPHRGRRGRQGRRGGDAGDARRRGLVRAGDPRDRGPVGEVGRDRLDRLDDHPDRRADQPAGAERGHRGRPRRRAGPRLRRRRRGGPQARRGLAVRRVGDRVADPGDPERDGQGRRRRAGRARSRRPRASTPSPGRAPRSSTSGPRSRT